MPRLRAMMTALLNDGEAAELHVTDTDTGLDLALKWERKLKPDLAAAMADWAGKFGLARITLGRDVAVQLTQPMLRVGKADLALPSRAFLQPTREGEAALQGQVAGLLKGAKRIADLFAGCGTFTLPLAEAARLHAVELEAGAAGSARPGPCATPRG